MAWDEALPYGLRDTKVTPYATPSTLGTISDVPNARTMSFTEAEEFTELRGDDKVVAIRGQGPGVEWEMENGGISIPAFKNMNGETNATSGTNQNQGTTYNKKVTDR